MQKVSHTPSLITFELDQLQSRKATLDSQIREVTSTGVSPEAVLTACTPEKSVPCLKRFKQRVAVNQTTTLPWCLSEDVDGYGQSGIHGIGLSWRKMTEFGLRRAVRLVSDSDLVVSSVGPIGGFTGKNDYSIKDAMADARRVIRVAGQVRARTVTVLSGPIAGHIRKHANRIVVEALRELVPFAALYGVELALQPMHPMFASNWSFLHTLDETVELMDLVGDSRLKLAFGTYHHWQDSSLLSRLPELVSRIGLVSLADWGSAPRHDYDRLFPGQGRLPIHDMILALENNHYSGWYELEVWSRDLWKMDRRDLMQECVAVRDKLLS
ncbi:sugar phosphate isomerase/epimerase family protein [Planctomicrobium sp. SH668]|uniref:sugar phosphate isomerase/epimerase family protein n=1 Tax=Planctomicrobium sp. SH668 TaxID=3448126 RepID=UPI003F5B92E3